MWASGVFNGFVYSDSQSNTYTQKVTSISASSSGASTYLATATVATGATDTVTVATGGANRIYAFAALEYRNVQGFGLTATSQNDGVPNGATSDTSTLTFTGTAGSGGAIVEVGQIGQIPSTTPTIAYNNGQTQRILSTPNGGGALQGLESDDYAVAAVSFSISSTWSWSPSCSGTCSDSRVGLELLGSSTQPVTTITQCYGNCGTPAVKLVNTNSTHFLNWNQSLTFFYVFQPTISGFLNNVTTSLPKTYTNSFYAPFLALYQSNCPLGQTPFSQQCPGLTVVQGQTSSAAKGKQSLIAGPQYVIQTQSNIYYGVALSFQIAPEDANDTNTAVAIHVTTGITPSVITQDGVFDPGSKIGIWAWITGNIISSIPPPTPTFNCSGLLDCILPQLAQSFCSNATPSCVNAGGLIEVVILTIVSVFFVAKTAGEVGNVKVSIGELILFFGILWIFVISGVGILFIWVPVVIFFIVSLLMSKQVGRGIL